MPRSYDPAWAASARELMVEACELTAGAVDYISTGHVDLDDLDELRRLGEEAAGLLDSLDEGRCGCSDPSCPCDGIKVGVP